MSDRHRADNTASAVNNAEITRASTVSYNSLGENTVHTKRWYRCVVTIARKKRTWADLSTERSEARCRMEPPLAKKEVAERAGKP